MTKEFSNVVIPSEVEGFRDEALELFGGILRLRCAPLRMTVLSSFVLQHRFVIRHSDFVIFCICGIVPRKG